MWILVVRAPAPDKGYWVGRRALAVVDALLWPLLAWMTLAHMPGAGGIAKPMGAALALLLALCRLDTAWRQNHRYRFATWGLARIGLVLLVVGALLKVMLTF